MKDQLKEYCKSRKLNFVNYYDDKNWQLFKFQLQFMPEEALETSGLRIHILEFLYTAIDNEMKRELQNINLTNILEITADNNRILFKGI